ncbi:type I toxin-antitoxin system Fst family toxin [Staphylococcus sp. 57-74]|nr:type I toxin-antitoxin system Fst family toxin [Staphylococcus borealis]
MREFLDPLSLKRQFKRRAQVPDKWWKLNITTTVISECIVALFTHWLRKCNDK